MGKSYPQSNFGQINKVTATLMIIFDANFASKRFSSDAEKKKGNGMWGSSKVTTHMPQQFYIFTVAISYLRTKKELGDRKLRFDWLNFINQGPKFWGFMA